MQTRENENLDDEIAKNEEERHKGLLTSLRHFCRLKRETEGKSGFCGHLYIDGI